MRQAPDSQALYVIAKLDIATQLDEGPKTVADLAAACGAQPEPLGRLIRTLAPMGVFRSLPDGTVETTPLGATLSAHRADSVRAATLYWMKTHYLPFSELLHNVRTGETAATHYFGEPFFDWVVKDSELVEVQSGAMASVTGGLGAGMFEGYRLPAGEVVADIGGASGSVLVQLRGRVRAAPLVGGFHAGPHRGDPEPVLFHRGDPAAANGYECSGTRIR